jgi:D-aminoacyl-tRNA deacylase
MIALLQRVKKARVKINNEVASGISEGILIFLGIVKGDSDEDCQRLVSKILKFRIFEDKQGKMNLTLQEAGAALLVVSEFTLAADVEKGNRPSFSKAEDKDRARYLYQYFIELLKNKSGRDVKSGKFAEYMQVELVNDGPVTFILDSTKR